MRMGMGAGCNAMLGTCVGLAVSKKEKKNNMMLQ